MAKKKRQPREITPVDFDMTPMIDVTFQLLIFFILTMKVIPRERQAAAYLPEDEGPAPMEAEAKEQLTLRLFWNNGEMIYEINTKFGNTEGKGPRAVHAGTMADLMNGRNDPGASEYKRISGELYDTIVALAGKVPKAEKIEIAMDQKTKESSRLHIEETSPWGFVTLALDVCTKINAWCRDEANRKEMSVTFKNTAPAGPEKIRQ